MLCRLASVADPETSERGAKKCEIQVATLGGHLFYDYFLQAGGGMAPLPPPPPGSATEHVKDLKHVMNKPTMYGAILPAMGYNTLFI